MYDTDKKIFINVRLELFAGLLLVLTLMSAFSAAAETATPRPHDESVALQIPDDIRALLNQEMQEVSKGMQALVRDVAAGNWQAVEKTAGSIQNSYIMAQRLSDHQRHLLHDALPAEFQELDSRFHHYAGMLGHVAQERDLELVHFYIYKMNEACTSCHARFAQHRFQGFAEPDRHRRHSH